MHVGMASIFQNPDRQLLDCDVYRSELRLSSLAEPLGFDSIWGVEHHFTDYTMCPDVVQFLTYMAGRTERVQLGTMVVVLPWHNPMRVAEEVAMLDAMCGGRLIFGMGRGLGRIEFDGLGVKMDESRGRFVESAEMILEGLERGYCEYDGEFIHQPRRDIRPAPFKSFKGRSYAAAVSPESVPIMAKLGVGILIIPQKPWDVVATELHEYRSIYREVNGKDAPPTIAAGWTFCDKDEGRAREMAVRYIGGYWKSVVKHYELGSEHFAKTKGYEHYAGVSSIVQQGGTDALTEFFLGLQIWGTPEQCYEKILELRSRVNAGSFVGVFSYAGMPYDEAERNLRLFASEVMPELKQLDEVPAVTLGAAQPAA